jgi:hypothetical protein
MLQPCESHLALPYPHSLRLCRKPFSGAAGRHGAVRRTASPPDSRGEPILVRLLPHPRGLLRYLCLCACPHPMRSAMLKLSVGADIMNVRQYFKRPGAGPHPFQPIRGSYKPRLLIHFPEPHHWQIPAHRQAEMMFGAAVIGRILAFAKGAIRAVQRTVSPPRRS